MIDGVFRLGRGLEDKPLLYPTIYNAVVFTVFVGLFKASENEPRRESTPASA